MNEEIVIDLLSEQAIKLASLVWKKEPAEARDIIWHSLEAMETSQRITLSEFQAYLQRKARPKFFTNCPVCGAETPPAFTNCPACNVNLEIVRSNAIKEFALEFAQRKSELKSQLKEEQTRLEEAQSTQGNTVIRLQIIGGFKGILKKLPNYITQADPQEVNNQLRTFISKIIISPTTVKIELID